MNIPDIQGIFQVFSGFVRFYKILKENIKEFACLITAPPIPPAAAHRILHRMSKMRKLKKPVSTVIRTPVPINSVSAGTPQTRLFTMLLICVTFSIMQILLPFPFWLLFTCSQQAFFLKFIPVIF